MYSTGKTRKTRDRVKGDKYQKRYYTGGMVRIQIPETSDAGIYVPSITLKSRVYVVDCLSVSTH